MEPVDPSTIPAGAGWLASAFAIIAMLVREVMHRGTAVEKLVEAITQNTAAYQAGQASIKAAIDRNTEQTVEHIDMVGEQARECARGLTSQASDIKIATELLRGLRSVRN